MTDKNLVSIKNMIQLFKLSNLNLYYILLELEFSIHNGQDICSGKSFLTLIKVKYGLHEGDDVAV
jgi:hypothetical protein